MSKIRLFGKPLSLILLVIYEGLFGLVKIIFGLSLLLESYLVKASVSNQLFQKIIEKELAEDPQDVFAHWVLGQSLANTTIIHIGWLLIILGLINFIIAVGVWFRSWAIRNFGVFFFATIGIFGIYEIFFVKFSSLGFVGLAIDVFLFYYFWKKLPRYLERTAEMGPKKAL